MQRQCNQFLNYQYLILKLTATHTAHMAPHYVRVNNRGRATNHIPAVALSYCSIASAVWKGNVQDEIIKTNNIKLINQNKNS